ncbi:hypothetical protein D3C86_1850940 [compost metagenome]
MVGNIEPIIVRGVERFVVRPVELEHLRNVHEIRMALLVPTHILIIVVHLFHGVQTAPPGLGRRRVDPVVIRNLNAEIVGAEMISPPQKPVIHKVIEILGVRCG